MITPAEMVSSKIRDRGKYKAITYIDGFNLYFGIREQAIKLGTRETPSRRWYRYMWLDLTALSRNLLTPLQRLVNTKYFTAQISTSRAKQQRQNTYLDALRTLKDLNIVLGRFEPNRNECDRCGHPAYHPQEKKTDVNIATHLICDAIQDRYDTAILVTGDSDLVPSVQAVRRLRPDKRVVIAFPPNRYSKELEDASYGRPIRIWEPLLRKSRLPEVIKRPGLPDLVCPETWTYTTIDETPRPT